MEWANARYIAQAATFVEGTATILMTLSREYYVLVGYIIVFSLCEGAFISTLNFIPLTVVPEKQIASSIGWQWVTSSFFLASGPPLTGKSSHSRGDCHALLRDYGAGILRIFVQTIMKLVLGNQTHAQHFL